jgi:phenylalanyl-tRNA synthetase beta chain
VSGSGAAFVTLDEIERQLPDGSLMICDNRRPVAIGGIMGGLNSGVLEDTTSVLLESAYFTPASINRTSRSLNLKTEASQRFEKGIDINGVIPSLHRAASLMAELSGGTVAQGCIDAYPRPLPGPRPLPVSISKINKIAGTRLSQSDMTGILRRLQFTVNETGTDMLSVAAPSFRYDIAEPVDIVEEIVRISGYDDIPVTAPSAAVACAPVSQALSCSGVARAAMIAAGFSEVINYSFTAPEMIGALRLAPEDPRAAPVLIRNPLSSAQSVLRTTLLPGLLENLRENIANAATSIKLFELGRVFTIEPGRQQPRETRMLAAAIAGLRYGQQCFLPQTPVDFFDIKAALFSLLRSLHITPERLITDARQPYLHPSKMLTLHMGESCIGSIGEMHPGVLEALALREQVFVFELDFDLLTSYANPKVQFRPFSRQPAVFRDIALIVDENIPAGKIYDTVLSFDNKLITDIAVFDVFRGGSLPPGTKSLAFRIKFQSPERTLTDAEVNKIHDRLVSCITRETGAQLR